MITIKTRVGSTTFDGLVEFPEFEPEDIVSKPEVTEIPLEALRQNTATSVVTNPTETLYVEWPDEEIYRLNMPFPGPYYYSFKNFYVDGTVTNFPGPYPYENEFGLPYLQFYWGWKVYQSNISKIELTVSAQNGTEEYHFIVLKPE